MIGLPGYVGTTDARTQSSNQGGPWGVPDPRRVLAWRPRLGMRGSTRDTVRCRAQYHHDAQEENAMQRVIIGFAIVSLVLCGSLAPIARASDANRELLDATKIGDTEKVKASLDKGADVNAVEDQSGITPLINAVLVGNRDVVKLLLEKGAKVNARTTGGVTALMAVSLDAGKVDIAKILMEKGAEVNEKTPAGMTALKYSLFRERMEQDAAEKLGEKGLKPKGQAPPAESNPMADFLKNSGAKEH